MEEEHLPKLDIPVWDIPQHVLVVHQSLACRRVLAGEVLCDGEGDPIPAHARLRPEDLLADRDVVFVVAQVDGEGREVVQEVERVLRAESVGQFGGDPGASGRGGMPFRFRTPFCST